MTQKNKPNGGKGREKIEFIDPRDLSRLDNLYSWFLGFDDASPPPECWAGAVYGAFDNLSKLPKIIQSIYDNVHFPDCSSSIDELNESLKERFDMQNSYLSDIGEALLNLAESVDNLSIKACRKRISEELPKGVKTLRQFDKQERERR